MACRTSIINQNNHRYLPSAGSAPGIFTTGSDINEIVELVVPTIYTRVPEAPVQAEKVGAIHQK